MSNTHRAKDSQKRPRFNQPKLHFPKLLMLDSTQFDVSFWLLL